MQLYSNNYAKNTHNLLTAFCLGLSGLYQKKHSPTHTHPDHWTSFVNFLHLLRSIASSLFSLRAWQSFWQPLSRSSLVLDPLLHTPCISSPNLFAAHACSAVIPMPCHLYLISLSSLLGNLSFSLMPHIHLTILILYAKNLPRNVRSLVKWH